MVNESTLICLPVLTYFFSIIHPSFVRKKETTRLEDDATPNRRYSVFFRPSGKQKSWTNEFVLEIFSAYPNIRGSDQLLIPGLVPSQLDSSSPKAREDWLPFLLDCAGTPLGQRLFG